MSTTVYFAAADILSRDWSPESPSATALELAEGGPSGDDVIHVTPNRAKTLSAFWQALTVLSNDVAQLPMLVYRRMEPQGKERAKGHPVYRLLHRRPNASLGPFTFKELMMHRCLLHGNAYAFIERSSRGGGAPINLWPIEPGELQPVRKNGVVYYEHIDSERQTKEVYDYEDVFHLRGPGGDLLQGQSIVSIARESLAVGLQSQRYGARFFANDAKPGLVLEYPEAVDRDTAQNILRNWERRHAGAKNAGRPAFLDRGGSVKSFSMSNEDAQFLETREFSRSEIASWFNLPPHKVGDLTRATFSNIEQQSIEYVVNSLMPWLIRWQDESNIKLFAEKEQENEEYFVEFLVAALLKGDYNSRIDGHTKAISWGISTLNEVRAAENLNPLPGELGNKHYIPMNMTAVGDNNAVEADQSDAQSDDERNARTIAREFFCSELLRGAKALAHHVKRRAGETNALLAYMRDAMPADLQDLEANLQRVAAITGGFAAQEVAECVADEFRRIVLDECELGNQNLKARVGGRLLALAQDLSAAMSAKLWR